MVANMTCLRIIFPYINSGCRMHFSFVDLFRKPSARHWHVIAAVCFSGMLAVELFGLQMLSITEFQLADHYLRRHASQQKPDPDIVVVDIDDPSMVAMQEIAGLWSWPREIHADLLEGLLTFAPRAIVFDMTFSVPDAKRPLSDARLSDALKTSSIVYLPAVRVAESSKTAAAALPELAKAFDMSQPGRAGTHATLELPHAIDRSAWRLGLINSLKDTDGLLRRSPLQTEVGGWKLPSMPARIARDLGVALPDGKEFLMRWARADDLHRHYSYGRLYRILTEQRMALGETERRQFDAEFAPLFHNKIIVIGASATSAFDHHLTPMGENIPGVDILATAIDNLKNRQSVRIVPAALPFGFGVVMIVGLAWAFATRKNPVLIGSLFGLTSAASLALADAAIAHNLLLPLATPLAFASGWFLAAAIGGYVRERRQREQAVSLFGRFLNPNVVRQIVDQGETVESLSGRTSQISVLFSDIRGFTSLSESRSPQEVVTLLNRYFDRQVDVVFRHGGTLDKFIGDCIMAFWGAPVDDPAHAEHAVAAALEMQEVLLAFKKELANEAASVPDFEVGIGVHSGPAVVGFIGAQKKLDYTAIGDTVNLASRIEGLTKGVARLLVSEETMRACSASAAIEFVPHGAFAVKGRAAEVTLYEPIRKPS